MPTLQEAPHTFLFPVEEKRIEKSDTFQIQNRRFLGNKHKLLNFIVDIVTCQCGEIKSLCDIFAGTGVVGHRFNTKHIKVISNDVLYSNFLPLKTFLKATHIDINKLQKKLDILNNLTPESENYFSKHFGGTYFTKKNAK